MLPADLSKVSGVITMPLKSFLEKYVKKNMNMGQILWNEIMEQYSLKLKVLYAVLSKIKQPFFSTLSILYYSHSWFALKMFLGNTRFQYHISKVNGGNCVLV